ncbi:MAG TPA: hypothetical protein VLL72_12380, partial [Kiloniellales bacterium]|nr:hypothetical protein [Kiloniellales bacterium]
FCLISTPSRGTMSQKSSLAQYPQSLSLAPTPNRLGVNGPTVCTGQGDDIQSSRAKSPSFPLVQIKPFPVRCDRKIAANDGYMKVRRPKTLIVSVFA